MTRTIVTPEIKRRILEMARERMTNKEIVAAIALPGLRADYVASIITKARRDGAIIPYRARAYEARAEERAAQLVPLTITIDKGSLDYLKGIGDRRGVSSDYIAAALIEAIAHDNMADAVLDDGVQSQSVASA